MSSMYTSIRAKRKQQLRTRAAILAAIVVLIGGGLWSAAQQREVKKDRQENSVLQHDLKLLWKWSDKLFKDGADSAEWSFRWDAEGEEATVERLVQMLTDADENLKEGMLYVDGADTASIEMPSYGGLLTIHSIPSGQKRKAILLYQSNINSSDAGMQAGLNEAIAKVEGVLLQIGADYTEGMSVRGTADRKDAVERLASDANAKQLDRYDDGGTVSASFYTEGLYISTPIAEGSRKRVNLQGALHQDTDTGEQNLIIGVPLITGDYSVSGND
ncbi:YwmB family TATA-box binding protein [Paenibacillus sp. NEAU-GSW1]|uniref:YwmB family TATA-box binding protein n=1 Tax=Paenibacillus sp. NEAU-GSW1 TaxID=2682486 RepID=UPI0012E2C0FA|nr:YwmB family TATA-box binding protein [Paenibacillus sp. NEAU-GSW1]MUT68663.1 hypothetical protein [Paenibacillus sp. NEAU-GSW1]